MPYRAELKRPDLKGNFPCTVCGKVFCHSSSLSRHRMQAHFKSYTCTLCNQEISSNETLRSHMFRSHEISRMFMCRCCNWAFPDKTSLHIHMQSMMRHGQPGDVNILAKSSTEGGSPVPPSNTLATATMEPDARGPALLPPNGLGDLFTSPKAPGPANGIFPSMASRDDLLSRMRGLNSSPARNPLMGMGIGGPGHLQAALSAMASNGGGSNALLQQWLANNFSGLMGGPTRVPTSLGCGLDSASLNLGERAPDESSVFSDDGLEINLNAEDDGASPEPGHLAVAASDSMPSNGDGFDEHTAKVEPADPIDALPVHRAPQPNPLNSLLYKKKLSGSLRGGSVGRGGASLADFLASRGNGGMGAAAETVKEETQPSPAASDSQSSSTGAPASDGSSPLKCYECQVTKGKLLVGENRNRFLESKVGTLESKIGRLESRVAGYEANARRYEGEQKGLRKQCELLERKLLNCQEKALRYLQDSNNNGAGGSMLLMKDLLEDLLQTPALDALAAPFAGDGSPGAKKPRICA